VTATVLHGDCLEVMRGMPEASVDAVCTDPPYHLTSIVKRFGKENSAPAKSNGATGVYGRAAAGFMGQSWDGGNIAADPATWAEVYRVLKPGGHLVAFGGSRTFHRMACAIEDAGFEIRDQIMWLYGSGFPKSHDVSKAIDKAAGAEREVVGVNPTYRALQDNASAYNLRRNPHLTVPATDAGREWAGWGTALKPAHEPIVLARKPLAEPTVAAQVLATGTGALNIDGCRVGASKNVPASGSGSRNVYGSGLGADREGTSGFNPTIGRWPANVAHDGSDEVLEAFSAFGWRRSGEPVGERGRGGIWAPGNGKPCGPQYGDSGTAARFFYCAKASRAERDAGLDELPRRENANWPQSLDGNDKRGARPRSNTHPTVKPVALMAWLVRLVTPPGGLVLDPFGGSGSTAVACIREGFDCVLIEREAEYVEIARRRIAHAEAAVPLPPPQPNLFAEAS
jgi:site-specific DNA-methyltransferase (adenine-specific)